MRPASPCPESRQRPGDTTQDTVLGGRVILVQPRQGYRAAIDPILLAASVPAQSGEVVVDAGCGVGTAALCLAVRIPGVRVLGLEKQIDYALMAGRGAWLTNVADRVAIVAGCLTAPPLGPGCADRIMTNPPFGVRGRGRSPRADRAVSMAEDDVDLSGWINAVHWLLKPRGWLTLIHRADRIDDILQVLKPRFGAITIQPIHSRAGHPARRVIVNARRDVKTPAAIAPGFILHDADGGYTAAARHVLNNAGDSPLQPYDP